ncbi:hypothetical protein ACMFMF_009793 [Clarireedia jacksonii]
MKLSIAYECHLSGVYDVIQRQGAGQGDGCGLVSESLDQPDTSQISREPRPRNIAIYASSNKLSQASWSILMLESFLHPQLPRIYLSEMNLLVFRYYHHH